MQLFAANYPSSIFVALPSNTNTQPDNLLPCKRLMQTYAPLCTALYNSNNGRWTVEEKDSFHRAVKKHGKNWHKIQEAVPTRTKDQIRSHAQKYFQGTSKDSDSSDDSQSESSNKKNTINTSNTPISGISCDFAEEGTQVNLIREYTREVDELFHDVTSLIQQITIHIQSNYGCSKLPGMLELLKTKSEELKAKSNAIKPLPATALKNLAELKKDIDNIASWCCSMNSEREEYKKWKFIYSAVCNEIIDISKFNFLSLIRRKPIKLHSSTNGFVPVQSR